MAFFIFLLFSAIPWEERRPLALESIRRYRDEGRPFEMHNSLTRSWRELSLPLSPFIWFHYYQELDSLLQPCDPGTDIFIDETLMVPFLTIPFNHR